MSKPIGRNNQEDEMVGSIYTYTDSGGVLSELQSDSVQSLQFHVENIGGIKQCTFELSRGITVLVGENASNRTSTLRGIGAAIGADTGTVRSGATDASASVTVVTEDGERTLTREYSSLHGEKLQTTFSDTLTKKGVDALTDFAVLLEENRLRRAVRRGEDLYDILMSPIDTESVQGRIEQLQKERSELDQQIEELKTQRERIPGLKQENRSISQEISAIEDELESKQTVMNSLKQDSMKSAKSDELTEELQSHRREQERIESSIQREQESIEALREQWEELETELESLTVESDQLESIKDRISRMEGRKRELEDVISSLSTVAGLNKDAIDSDITSFVAESDITSALNPGEQSIKCWTCGTAVERRTIESRTQEIQQLATEKRNRRDELEAELSELREKRDEIHEHRRRQKTLESKVETIESEISDRQQRLSELREEKATNNETIDELETELAALDTDSGSESADKVELSQEIGELDATLSQLRNKHSEIDKELEKISEGVEDLSEYTARREQLTEQIHELREVVSEKENELVTSFNEHMNELLEYLAFDNLARVWLEKRTSERGDTEFVLHITREDGGVYEGRISTLSESEREVVGLMTAVVGHSVHNVGDVFPLMVLDSVEAIDASRIARLVNYLQDHTLFLVMALLKEDAAELPSSYTRAALCAD